ncbi:MAG: cyclic nucleotide-binding domain-containing protein [bacterium]
MSQELDDMDSESLEVNPLGNLELFRGLSAAEIREILHTGERRTFEPGEVVFTEGQSAHSMFVIETGELEVKSRGEADEPVVLAQLGAGSIVGEMAILDGFSLRSATVAAVSDVSAFELTREAFTALRDGQSHAAYKLILNLARILGERRRRADARVAEVFQDPSKHIDAFESQVHDMLGRLKKV